MYCTGFTTCWICLLMANLKSNYSISEDNNINGYLPLTVFQWGTIFQVVCVGKLGFKKPIQWYISIDTTAPSINSCTLTQQLCSQTPFWCSKSTKKSSLSSFTAYLCRDVKDSIKISFTLYKKSTTTVHYLHDPTPFAGHLHVWGLP